MATLGLQIVFSSVFLNWSDITGGEGGLSISRPEFWGLQLSSITSYAALTLAFCVICFIVALWIAQSGYGKVLKALREDELSAQSLGKNTFSCLLTIFGVSAGLAAVGGSLYAYYYQFINPTCFTIHDSIMILIIVVVGGAGNLWGSLVGAVVLVTLPEILSFIPAMSIFFAQIRVVIFSVVLLILIFLRPQGLLGEFRFGVVQTRKESARLNGRGIQELGRQVAMVSDEGCVKQRGLDVPIMEVSDLSKSFGGIKAVQDVSFAITPGEVTGIIGPNGAGKTTLFNLVCGYLTPDKGEVYFRGKNVTELSPYKRARIGFGRSFQDLRLFGRLTVLDNIILALQSYRTDENLLRIFLFPIKTRQRKRQLREEGLRILEGLGLSDKKDELVEDISYAEQKLLAVTRVVAIQAEVLMLDEVAAGLDLGSMKALSQLLRTIAQKGRAVCLVEHNLEFVMSTVDRIIFVNEGCLIAEGSPEEIIQDRKLAEIYFGGVRGC